MSSLLPFPTATHYHRQQFVGEDHRCRDKSRKNGRLGAGKSALRVSFVIIIPSSSENGSLLLGHLLLIRCVVVLVQIQIWSHKYNWPSSVATRVTRSRILAAVDRRHGTDSSALRSPVRPQGHCAVPHLVRPQDHHQHARQWNVSTALAWASPGKGWLLGSLGINLREERKVFQFQEGRLCRCDLCRWRVGVCFRFLGGAEEG